MVVAVILLSPAIGHAIAGVFIRWYEKHHPIYVPDWVVERMPDD